MLVMLGFQGQRYMLLNGTCMKRAGREATRRRQEEGARVGLPARARVLSAR